MKLVLFALLFVSGMANAQRISIKKLIALQNNTFTQAETYLNQQGWDYESSEKPTDSTVGMTTWSYGKGDDQQAEAWFMLINPSKDQKRVHYQFIDKQLYIQMEKDLAAMGYKRDKTKLKTDSMEKIYAKGNLTVILEQSASSKTSYMYDVTVLTSVDYLINFYKK